MTIESMNNLLDIPAQLEKLAGEIRSGSIKEESCIVILTGNEQDNYASYSFGEDLFYTEAIACVGRLLSELESELMDVPVETIN